MEARFFNEKKTLQDKIQNVEYELKKAVLACDLEKKQREKTKANLQYLEKVMDDKERQYKQELEKNIRLKEKEINAICMEKARQEMEGRFNQSQIEKEQNEVEFKTKLNEITMQLTRQTTEITFLKNTVRIECEERMGLMSQLATVKLSSPVMTTHGTNKSQPSETDIAAKLYEKNFLRLGTPTRQKMRN